MQGMDKIPSQDEYEETLKGNEVLNEEIVNFCKLKELAYDDMILSISTSSFVGKLVLGLLKNA